MISARYASVKRRLVPAAAAGVAVLLSACSGLDAQQSAPSLFTIHVPTTNVVIGRPAQMPAVEVTRVGLPEAAKVLVTFAIMEGPTGGTFISGKKEEQTAVSPGAQAPVPRLANVPGKYAIRVRAEVQGAAEARTASFELVSTVGPKRLQLEAGTAPECRAGKPCQAPDVHVVDESGQPVYGAEVVFRLTGKNVFTLGETSVRAVTDESGRAEARSFRPEKKGLVEISVNASLLPGLDDKTTIEQKIAGGGCAACIVLPIIAGGAVGGLCGGKVICGSKDGGGGGGGGGTTNQPVILQPGRIGIGAP